MGGFHFPNSRDGFSRMKPQRTYEFKKSLWWVPRCAVEPKVAKAANHTF